MICILNNSHYFTIVANALHHCFTELGVAHSITTDFNDHDLFIVFNAHELNRRLPKRYIVYNFEQLTASNRMSHEFVNRLTSALHVWDYSQENIRVLETSKINAKFVPLGYCTTMEPVTPNQTVALSSRPIDYIFTGGCIDISPRTNILNDLQQSYINCIHKLHLTNRCWGIDLIHAYRRAKIGLNLHFYKGHTILEVHRIIPLIVNRVWVLSEYSMDPWYDAQFSELVTFFDQGKLAEIGAPILALSDATFDAELNLRYDKLTTNCRYIDFIRSSGLLADLSTI